MIRNAKAIVLLAVVLLSAFSIALPLFAKRSGVEVVAVDDGSKCTVVKTGDVITQINDARIDNSFDFSAATKNLAAGSYATMIINNGPGGCNAIGIGDVGLVVKDMPSGGLKLGLEIGGGTTNIYEPADYSKSSAEKTIPVIKKRIESIGPQDTKVYLFDGNDKKTYLKISGISDENFNVLTVNGRFEARITQNVEIKDGSGKIVVGERTHSVAYSEGINIDGAKRIVGDEFLLDGIKFYLANFTNMSATLDALLFSNEDVTNVFTTASYVSYQSSMGQYEFYIPVGITNSAANRFANLTKRMGTKIVGSNNVLLDGSLIYLLDGNTISVLPISFESAGKAMDAMAIIGFDTSARSANSVKAKIETVLRSGSLPISLKLTGSEKYTGSLEHVMRYYVPVSAVVVVLAVAALGRMKSGSWKNGLYSIAISLAEIVFALGLISAVQEMGYSWVVDAETIAGLFVIAFIGYADSYFKMGKKKRTILKLCVFTASFITLFTSLRGFGMVLMAAMALKIILTGSMRVRLAEASVSKA